jgi:3-oxoacyl-[acyl-carrier-protein] synthase-3
VSVIRSAVTGVGAFLPEKIVTNADLAKFVDTSDEWIVERTGIRQRHQAAPDQPTSDLAVEAAKRALEQAGKTVADVDLIIVATTTPDSTFPATAALVQKKLGCPVGIAFDVQAVCSGFVYAMSVADGFVARGMSKCALVIGAEEMTRLMDWEDRTTCVLFGDGAGAFVLEPREGQGTKQDQGILGFALRCDGSKSDLLYVDGGPATTGTVGHLRMAGNVEIPEIDWFVPHQANQRIIRGVGERLGLDETKVISTVDKHANTSAASIPLAMDSAMQDGRIKKGDLIVLEAMGGGLTWGACTFRL